VILFKDVYKKMGGEAVLGGLSFGLPTNRICCLTGPSGCGKTTTLRMLAGLEYPDAGSVSMPPGSVVSFSFQEPRLLPWKTAEENIAFVLQDVAAGELCREIVREYMELMGMWEYRKYYPAAMSGGMRQRLGLCRALAYPHNVLLLDEPFQSLDMPLKTSILRALQRIWASSPRTVVYVTHDITESVLLAHKVIVFSKKPAVARKEFIIDIPPVERKLGDSRLAEIMSEILNVLEDASQS